MSEANPYGRRRDEPKSAEEMLAGGLAKEVPWSDEAEQAVISAMLQDAEGFVPMARAKLRPEAFYREGNRLVFEKVLELVDANQPLDVVLLTHALREKGLLERVGGAAGVSDLWTFVPGARHGEHYLKIVLEKWLARQAVHEALLTVDAMQRLGEEGGEVLPAVMSAEQRMFSLVEQAQGMGESKEGALMASQGVMEWVDHLQRTIDNRGKVLGLTTGIHELDLTLHGIDDGEGEICVIAGRPAMGKTAMGGTIVHHLAVERGIPGLVFSIEMTANQLYTRLILGPAGVDTSKAITGHFSREDHEVIRMMTRQVQRAPLQVCASAAVNTADLRAQVQLAKRRYGIRWILVDHLHLVKSVNPKISGDERMRLVEVMETLQFLKKEHKLGVILLVQMNRDTDKKFGQPPVLADLAGSAAIEQYADHVIFIHREDEYVKWHRLSEDKQEAWREQIEPRRQRSPELWSDGTKYGDDDGGYARQDYEEKAMLFVRKNRRGPTPELQIRYQKELTRFSTRMPKLQSTNPLDWQMGTYTPKRASKKMKQVASGERAPWEE